MSTEPRAGEVWIVDFGLAAKQRPVLILAYPQSDDARALVVVVPLTSQLRGCAEKWTSESPAGYRNIPR